MLLPLLAQTTQPTEVDSVWGTVVQHLGRTFHETSILAWGALLLAIFLGLLVGRLVRNLLMKFGEKWKAHGWHTRGMVLTDAAAPAALFIFASGLSIGMGGLVLSAQLRLLVIRAIALLYTIAVGWFMFNLVDVVEVSFQRFIGRHHSSTLALQVSPLVRRAIRIFLIIILGLYVAENVFQRDVSAWLAGLGIAGLAVSLAAQDSVKNLFGSFTVLMDRPFQVGHSIILGTYEGTVEEIGFRSTRIRTPDGTRVTIPNASLVDSTVINMTERNFIRRVMDIGLTIDTPPEKIEEAVQITRDVLNDPEVTKHFNMEKFPPRVAFNELKADSYNIRAYYWFIPANFWESFELAERVNLEIVRRFNDAGIDFAFPTRTLHVQPGTMEAIKGVLTNDRPGRPERKPALPSTSRPREERPSSPDADGLEEEPTDLGPGEH